MCIVFGKAPFFVLALPGIPYKNRLVELIVNNVRPSCTGDIFFDYPSALVIDISVDIIDEISMCKWIVLAVFVTAGGETYLNLP